MPIVEANQALPMRAPVILIFAEPGTCKTSIANTVNRIIVIDADRGVSRSKGRKTTLVINNWQEVKDLERSGKLKEYDAVAIDTAKAALDDFIMPHIVSNDARMGQPKFKLQLFGQIGEEFKLFINNLRNSNIAVLILAHAKKDEDSKKIVPDITGQSYQLILRISDQIGYAFIKNGKRVMTYEPSEGVIGKNTAQINGEIEIPHWESPAFKDFGQKMIEQVSASLQSMSDEQREAIAEVEKYQDWIEKSETLDDLGMLVEQVNELPVYLSHQLINLLGNKYKTFINACTSPADLDFLLETVNALSTNLKTGLRIEISGYATKQGWKPNVQTRKFEVAPATPADKAAAEQKPAPAEEKPILPAGKQPESESVKDEDAASATQLSILDLYNTKGNGKS